jgi:hypothetical protein
VCGNACGSEGRSNMQSYLKTVGIIAALLLTWLALLPLVA